MLLLLYSSSVAELSMILFSSTCSCVHVHTHTHTAKSSKTSKKGKKKQTAHTVVPIPDHTHLTFEYHKAIIATLALLPHLLTQSTHTSSSDAQSGQSESVREWEELVRVRPEPGEQEKVSMLGLTCCWSGWVVEHCLCLSTSVFPT